MRVAITTIAATLALTAAGAGEAVAAVPANGWTGFYGGLQIGIDSSRAKTFGQDSFDSFEGGEGFSNSASFATRHAPTQFLAGGTVGFNYQMGNFIMGLEAGANWISGGTSMTSFESADFGTNKVTSKTDGLYTIRARYGFLLDDVYIFATGGGAFSNVGIRFMGDDGANTVTHLNSGWTVGGGAETFITPDISIVTEAMFVDLGSKNVIGSSEFESVALQASAKQMVWTLGVNWHI